MSVSSSEDALGSIAKDSSTSSDSCIGETADNISAHKNFFEETFMFTEDLFKQYYLLHLRPHEIGLSSKMLRIAGAMLLLWAFMTIPYCVVRTKELSTSLIAGAASWSDYQHLAVGLPLLASVFFFIGVAAAAYSGWLLRGRHPNWNKSSWAKRLELSFGSIIMKQSDSPFDPRIESNSSVLGTTLALFPVDYWDTWADDDRYITPMWQISDPVDALSTKPYAVPFAVRIYSDHIERGSEESHYAVAFEDLYDILEHKRFPDIAILRSKQYGETVLLKDGFEEARWNEVRDFIERRILEARKSNRTECRNRLFGRKR